MPNDYLTPEQVRTYQQDGFLRIKGFCNPEEVHRLYRTALEDEALRTHALDLEDQAGKKTSLSLWFTPGNDVFGYLVRSCKMVQAVRQLLGEESPVCHFHSKLMQKKPRVGGSWEWHQDYGYWYKNQFLFPDQMMSVMVALTAATKENGCLQVIRGSHKMGRVNHGFAGEQVGADMEMVEHALKHMELVYCELEPGEALFFHSNLLHRSEANLSADPRWSLITCYNLQSNPAFCEKSFSYKVPLEMVPDEAILAWESGTLAGADFLTKEQDPALRDTGWEKEVRIK